MSKFGLTEERYAQMMELYGDEDEVAETVKEWGVEPCIKGYSIFDFNGTGMLEIEKIDSLCIFDDDEDAVKQAIKDGIKIIPVNELPENFDRKYLGWIDTPENREAIQKYCEKNIAKEKTTTETAKKVMLIFTNGYEIRTETFPATEEAQKEMQKQYEHFMPEELAEEWAENSNIGSMDAILYANGEDVFVWKVIEI